MSRRRPYFGWVLVALAFLNLILAMGTRLSFSVFFAVLVDAFGWSRAGASAVFSVNMAVAAVGALAGGWILDRWGPRVLFGGGGTLLALALLASSRIHTLSEWTLAYGLLGGLGVAALAVGPHAAWLSRWFARRRGTAVGLAFAGTGIGPLILVPGVERIIARWGWRSAYLLLALLMAGVLVPLNLAFARAEPAELGLGPDGDPLPAAPASGRDGLPRPEGGPRRPSRGTGPSLRQALGEPALWALILASAASLFTLRMVTVHQVAFLVDRGVDTFTAALVAGAASGSTALAFPLLGLLSDRIGRPRTFLLGSLFQAGALLALMVLAPSRAGLILYPLLWGLGEGSRSALLTALAGDLYAGPSLGSIVGLLTAAFAVGAGTGAWAAGAIFDRTGSYLPAFLLALTGVAVASAAVAWVGRGMGGRGD